MTLQFQVSSKYIYRTFPLQPLTVRITYSQIRDMEYGNAMFMYEYLCGNRFAEKYFYLHMYIHTCMAYVIFTRIRHSYE